MSFIIAFLHFISEATIYQTAGVTPGLILPVAISGTFLYVFYLVYSLVCTLSILYRGLAACISIKYLYTRMTNLYRVAIVLCVYSSLLVSVFLFAIQHSSVLLPLFSICFLSLCPYSGLLTIIVIVASSISCRFCLYLCLSLAS